MKLKNLGTFYDSRQFFFNLATSCIKIIIFLRHIRYELLFFYTFFQNFFFIPFREKFSKIFTFFQVFPLLSFLNVQTRSALTIVYIALLNIVEGNLTFNRFKVFFLIKFFICRLKLILFHYYIFLYPFFWKSQILLLFSNVS